jgi:HK97 family phage portal protein
VGLFTRAIRPPDDVTPNPNDPASVPPATVGPNVAQPGDPHGVEVEGPATTATTPPAIVPSVWSGWPADWLPPHWEARLVELTDTAWMCLDLNSSLMSTMPPYLVDAAPNLDADWINNPQPGVYASWEEFAKTLFWDYQLGEAFVLATSYYSTGWPARFYVVPPATVKVDIAAGVRRYRIGTVDVTDDMLHIRYQGNVSDAHGHGPLEVGAGRQVAARLLAQYATRLATSGIPSSVLEHPDELDPQQSADLQAQWVQARMSTIGEPAVLSGGVTWKPTQLSPRDMALLELQSFNESRIAVLLGVPPFIVGLPSGGDPMTYSNVSQIFDFHWRAGLRPKAQAVMAALSAWALPRGTTLEVNRDAYVQPDPYVRAQTAEILNRIKDEQGNPVASVAEIRDRERFTSTPDPLSSGVLR